MDDITELREAYAAAACDQKPSLTVEELEERRRGSRKRLIRAIEKLEALELSEEADRLLTMLCDVISDVEKERGLMTAAVWYARREALHHGVALGLDFAGRTDILREFPDVCRFLWTLKSPRAKQLLRLAHSARA